MTRFFPYAVGLLQWGAAAVYVMNGQPRIALVWFCYGLSAFALAGAQS